MNQYADTRIGQQAHGMERIGQILALTVKGGINLALGRLYREAVAQDAGGEGFIRDAFQRNDLAGNGSGNLNPARQFGWFIGACRRSGSVVCRCRSFIFIQHKGRCEGNRKGDNHRQDGEKQTGMFGVNHAQQSERTHACEGVHHCTGHHND